MGVILDVQAQCSKVKKQSRWKEWLCWWTTGHYWNGRGSRTMASQEMNTCDYCQAKRTGS